MRVTRQQVKTFELQSRRPQTTASHFGDFMTLAKKCFPPTARLRAGATRKQLYWPKRYKILHITLWVHKKDIFVKSGCCFRLLEKIYIKKKTTYDQNERLK